MTANFRGKWSKLAHYTFVHRTGISKLEYRNADECFDWGFLVVFTVVV